MNLLDASGFRRIKTITIKAMYSDDFLMERLVLKGGNALDIVYNIAERASLDLDFSMPLDFHPHELSVVESRIREVLELTFREHGFDVFDVNFVQRPRKSRSHVKRFWGGYRVSFTLIESSLKPDPDSDMDSVRRLALVIGPHQLKTFTIDISKFEYCSPRRSAEVDGLTIYVYTPEMIVFEKIRAICQQSEEYTKIAGTDTRTPRSRDFFDIHTVLSHFRFDLASRENADLVKAIFEAKKVPLDFIESIARSREFHRQDFDTLRDTIKPGINLESFDFYFDFVIARCEALKPLWIE